MADFSSLKQTIRTYVKQNGNEEITGNILQDVLLAMVSTMGDSAINSLASALQDEIAARQNQDATLQGNISAEATARQQADTALGGRIDGLQTAINGINTKLAEGYIYAGIATPSTNPGTPSGKVFYIAVSSGTYTNFSNLTAAQGINILKYNGSAWSKDVVYAIDARPKKNSQNPVTSGGVFDNMGALDVSELNATENPHTPAIYADLSAALAAISTDYQKGGMSITFIQGTVQSSDNKYVQYRLMNTSWSIAVDDWQGVDDEPVAGSENFVKSGGVFLSNAKQLVAPDSDFTRPINALLSYTAKNNIDMSREYYLIYFGFRDGNRSRCIIQVKDGLNDLSNITDNVSFDGSDLLIHTIETDNFIFTIDTSLFPNNDTSTFIRYTYHLYKNVSLIHVDDEPNYGSDNPVKSGGVFSYVGNVEKLETYNADDGIIWDGTSVVNPSNRFNGTVIALQKGVTYTVTSIAFSIVVFDHQPNIGDTDGTVVDGSFTADNDGLYMLVTVRLEATDTVTITNASYGLAKDILDKCVQPKDIEDSLNSTNPEKVLSARQGNILGTEIYGTETETIINKPLVEDSYVKTTTVFRDGASTFEASVSENALEGCYCCKIPVSIGDRYTIFSAHANNSSVVGFCILTGNNNAVLSAIKICTQVVDLSITENGYLYVNLQDYNNQTDYVKQFVTVTVGGYKMYVHNYVDGKISDVNNYIDGKISDVNSRINHTYPLYGKKLVCLGDSLTEFKDNSGKRYSDYISELFYATTINCGIGGSQFRQRTTPVVNPSTNGEGYAGMDVISMVMAACGVMYDENTPYSTIVTNAANYIKTAASDDNTEIVQSLLSIDWSTVDGVILFAGTNDWKNGVGNWGNTGSNDVSTTLGAINKIIELLLSTYKHLKIYWFTPIVRWLNYDGGTGIDADWSDNKVSASGTDSANLRVFSKMIQDEVTLNHIPVCDMYNTLGINQSNFSQYFNDNDGTHPRKGMDLLAKKIATFIISNNTM